MTTHIRLRFLFLAVLGVVASFLVPVGAARANVAISWQELGTTGNHDLAVGANGAAWKIGAASRWGGYDIAAWNPTYARWTTVDGGAMRTAVAPDGTPWVVNSLHQIYRRSGGGWVLVPGGATDIAIGGNGAVWIVGTDARVGGYGVYQWNGSTWVGSGVAGVRIAVTNTGDTWLVNSAGRILRRNGIGWLTMPGSARDIGAGSEVWIVGTNPFGYGFGAWVFNGVHWVAVGGETTQITVAPGGQPWVLNPWGGVFRGRFSGRCGSARTTTCRAMAAEPSAFRWTTSAGTPDSCLMCQ